MVEIMQGVQITGAQPPPPSPLQTSDCLMEQHDDDIRINHSKLKNSV